MQPPTAANLRFALLALLSVLIAAPGVHLFEAFLDHRVAFWLSHGLALAGLALTFWRWRATRPRTAS